MSRRILSFMLILCLCMGSIPATAAYETESQGPLHRSCKFLTICQVFLIFYMPSKNKNTTLTSVLSM